MEFHPECSRVEHGQKAWVGVSLVSRGRVLGCKDFSENGTGFGCSISENGQKSKVGMIEWKKFLDRGFRCSVGLSLT